MTASVDNIVRIFGDAVTNMPDDSFLSAFEWYYSVNDLCHSVTPDNPRTFAGIIAALSPRLSWEKNIEYAHLVINGANKVPCLTTNANKAIAIRDGADPDDVLGGQKVTSFFDNIVNPLHSDSVTVDTHAAAIAFGDPRYAFKFGARLYREVAEMYREASAIMGYRPLEIQSISWEYWRSMHRWAKKNV